MQSKKTKQVNAHETLTNICNAMRITWRLAEEAFSSSLEYGHTYHGDLSPRSEKYRSTREAADTVMTVIEKALDDYGDYLKEFKYDRTEDDIKRSTIQQADHDFVEVVGELISTMECLEHKNERAFDPAKHDKIETLRGLTDRFENIDIYDIKEVHA